MYRLQNTSANIRDIARTPSGLTGALLEVCQVAFYIRGNLGISCPNKHCAAVVLVPVFRALPSKGGGP